MTHRLALIAKKLSTIYKNPLDEVFEILNLINSRPLINRILKILRKNMGSMHYVLILLTEARWLSRGE
jgi:hypothetical protein